VLLYVSHALWLAAGAVWFVVSNLMFRAPLRAALLRFASFVPVLIVAALWYPRLESAGFTSSTLWLQWPLGRVSPSWLVNAVFGGVRGPLEYVMTGLLVTWVLWSVWQRRHDTSSGVDRELLLVAALFTFAVLILPDKQSNTIYFASRWAPPAAIMLVLAVPPPRFAISLRRAATAGITAVFCLATTLAWVSFERFECSGLQEALNALPERPRVIGLDLIKTSEIIKGRPFLQMFAYAQVLRGGELNFSFAEFAPSVVVYKARRHPPWTAGLEWYAERARHTDFQHFDYAIVNAREAQHRQAAAVPQLAAAIDTGRWRLYRVRKPPA
jgi:hypothetical membrane protein